MRGFNFVPIRSDPMLIFLSGNQPLHYTTCLSTRLARGNDFSVAMQTMLHNMQLVSQFVLQFKNSEKSCEFCRLARNFWPRANRNVFNEVFNIASEVARRIVALCNTSKMLCNVAAIIAKSRSRLYFVQRLLQQKCCEA